MNYGEKMSIKQWIVAVMVAMSLPLMAHACGVGEQSAEGYENAPVAHAHEHWQQGSYSPIPFTFIDVRTPEEYAAGHISGSTLIPVDQIEQRLSEIPKDRQVYVYCHSGRRSAKASAILARHGFTNIENVVGGIEAWKSAGYPVEK